MASDVIIALLIVLATLIAWLTVEVRKLQRDIEPLATSPIAQGIAAAGRTS